MDKKPKRIKIKKPQEKTEVPPATEMDDDTFISHMELRHADECKIEGKVHRRAVEAWLPSWRAFHNRLHRLETPGQYDHVHESEEE